MNAANIGRDWALSAVGMFVFWWEKAPSFPPKISLKGHPSYPHCSQMQRTLSVFPIAKLIQDKAPSPGPAASVCAAAWTGGLYRWHLAEILSTPEPLGSWESGFGNRKLECLGLGCLHSSSWLGQAVLKTAWGRLCAFVRGFFLCLKPPCPLHCFQFVDFFFKIKGDCYILEVFPDLLSSILFKQTALRGSRLRWQPHI